MIITAGKCGIISTSLLSFGLPDNKMYIYQLNINNRMLIVYALGI
jgi:hypothetical protein